MKKILYLSFLFCLSFKTIAQIKLNTPNTADASPTAASLTKYADTPVSLYTGIANISIPIYQIKVRDASLAVGLGYHSGGIKVDEEASIVGLGWSLQAGGVISRSILGADDYSSYTDKVQYYNDGPLPLPGGATSIQDIPKNALPDNWINNGCNVFYNGASTPPNIVSALASFINKESSGNEFTSATWEAVIPQSRYEYEPDIYKFNFGGYSGSFIIDRDRKIFLESREKLKIIPPANASSGFEITTPDGALYKFNTLETISDLENIAGKSINVPISWFLSEIISPLGEKIVFTYESYTKQTRPLNGISQQYRLPGWTYGKVEGNSTQNACTGYYTTTFAQNKMEFKNQYLKEIVFNTGKIWFEYTDVVTQPREDIKEEKYLKRVVLAKALTATYSDIKEFKLEYGYFNSDPWINDDDYFLEQNSQYFEENYKNKRLKLLSVQERSLIDPSVKVNSYTFKYFEQEDGEDFRPNTLPQKTSYAKDFWGYSNGNFFNSTIGFGTDNYVKVNNDKLYPAMYDEFYFTGPNIGDGGDGQVSAYKTSTIIEGANRMPDPDFIKAWSLKKIIYPEGGETEYIYEGNEFKPESHLFPDKKIWTIRKRFLNYFYMGPGLVEREIDLNLSNVKHPIDANRVINTELKLTTALIFSKNVGSSNFWGTNGFGLTDYGQAKIELYDVATNQTVEVLYDLFNFQFLCEPGGDIDANTVLRCDNNNKPNETNTYTKIIVPIKTFIKPGRHYKLKVVLPQVWMNNRLINGDSVRCQQWDIKAEWYDTALDKYYGNGLRIKSIITRNKYDNAQNKAIVYDYSKKFDNNNLVSELQGQLNAPPLSHYYEFKIRSYVKCPNSGTESNETLFSTDSHMYVIRVPCEDGGRNCYQFAKLRTNDKYINDLYTSTQYMLICDKRVQECRNVVFSSENFLSSYSYVTYNNVLEEVAKLDNQLFIVKNKDLGFSIYSYNNEKPTIINYTNTIGGITFPIRPTPMSAIRNPLSGTLKKKTDFINYNLESQIFRPVKEVENSYSLNSDAGTFWSIEKIPYFSNFTFAGSSFYAYSNACDIRTYIYPALTSSWIKLDKTKETSYFYDNTTYALTGSMSNTTLYKYENESHLQQTTVITEKSNGKKNIAWSLYPEDYTDNTGFIADMKSKFVVKPVETVTAQLNSALTMDQLANADLKTLLSSMEVLGGSISTQKLNTSFSNLNCPTCTTIYPDENHLLETLKPISMSTFKFSNRSAVNKYPFDIGAGNFTIGMNEYKSRLKYDTYDALNNLTKFTVQSGQGLSQSTSMVWNGPFMTSVTKNSTLNQNAPSLTTTYEYDPLFGMTKETDENGISTIYDYDKLGRLEHISRKAGVNSAEKLKSYSYHYFSNNPSGGDFGPPSSPPVNAILTFNAVGDSVNRKYNLSWTATGSDIKYFEVYRFKETLDGQYVQTALISQSTMTDKYISYNIPYRYGIRGILSNGLPTAWKFTDTKILTNGCRGNGKIFRGMPIVGTFNTLDEACEEVTLEDGFITDDTGSYEARIKN